jgi:hypothetical protein
VFYAYKSAAGHSKAPRRSVVFGALRSGKPRCQGHVSTTGVHKSEKKKEVCGQPTVEARKSFWFERPYFYFLLGFPGPPPPLFLSPPPLPLALDESPLGERRSQTPQKNMSPLLKGSAKTAGLPKKHVGSLKKSECYPLWRITKSCLIRFGDPPHCLVLPLVDVLEALSSRQSAGPAIFLWRCVD